MDAAQDPPLRAILKFESFSVSIDEAQRKMEHFVKEAKYNLLDDKKDLSNNVEEYHQSEPSTIRNTDPVILSQIQRAADALVESKREFNQSCIL